MKLFSVKPLNEKLQKHKIKTCKIIKCSLYIIDIIKEFQYERI